MIQIVRKNLGITCAEKYLAKLCERSFLSLWSYPNVFGESGKELCDLLVVFENDIIIFSDKDCTFPNSGDFKKDWVNWYKRAVINSAKQAWGAERWIKNNPEKIFLNAKCTKKFPYNLPDIKKANFHLVLVAHQASKACKNYFGGSGSLMLSNDDNFAKQSGMPFAVGDLDKNRTYVHILDDTSLDLLMKTVDTITDFVRYLTKKEKFMRSGIGVISTGEESLLAFYLMKMNEKGEHDFILPDDRVNMISLDETIWESFENNPQRIAQKKADEISYYWDNLIESFAKHAFSNTQYIKQENNFQISEKILRFLARAPRFERRTLANGFIEILKKTPKNLRMLRCLPPAKNGDPYYVFLLFPWRDDKSEKDNRNVRSAFLEACCRVVKLKYPDALDVVGIATESGRGAMGSEDVAYFDARIWTKEIEEDTKKLQTELGILINPTIQRFHDKEYPESETRDNFVVPRNPRNKPCPCGATKPDGTPKKFKHCCGK
jgi:hypothetical protein